MSIFNALNVYLDADSSRSAAMNMAIDEALLETAGIPSIRFYRWNHPALSFGYFGRFADLREHSHRDLVRRWTGGGIVFHGEDLTYSIVVPVNDPAFKESPASIYERIHRALSGALTKIGLNPTLAVAHATGADDYCFANPVQADLMLNGRKIAGAAQRRTRRGLLQQGSIQVDLSEYFERKFADELAGNYRPCEIDKSIVSRANNIAAQKYATVAWLQKR